MRNAKESLLAPQWPLVFECLECMVAEFFAERHGRLRTKIRARVAGRLPKTFKNRETSPHAPWDHFHRDRAP